MVLVMVAGLFMVDKRKDVERLYEKRNSIEEKFGYPKVGSLCFQEYLNELIALEKSVRFQQK